jgi:hypothetical protein
MLLRAEEQFEFEDAMFSKAFPGTRQYHVFQQVFNVPLWIVDFFPIDQSNGLIGNPQRWSRQLTSSVQGLMSIQLASSSRRAQVRALLPAHTSPRGDIQLVRCSAIWNAHPLDDPEESTWLIETDHGPIADHELGLDPKDIIRTSLHWNDIGSKTL